MNTEIVYCYFYIINYTLGSGFLSIPYIFYKAGVFISTLTYLFYCMVTLLSALYIVEFLGRVHIIDKGLESEESQLNNDRSGEKGRLFLHSQSRKYEISESGQILFGYWVNVIITLLFCCFNMTSQWAYSAISASSLATNLPLDTPTFLTCNASEFIMRLPTQPRCLNLYRVSAAGYGIVVLVLSMIGLEKQKHLQLFLGLVRFTVLFSIILFSIVKIILDAVSPETITSVHTKNDTTNVTSAITYTDILLKVNILYVFYGIPIFLYSLQNHCFLPTALFTVSNKKVIKNLIIAIFLTLGISLATLGISISLAFSYKNNPSCVLNWLPYTHKTYHILLRIFAYIVIFFPAIDILSCYPLSTILQANILFQIIMRLDTSQIHTLRQRLILLSLRCIIAVSPLLLSLFVANLIIITDISGLFSIALVMITPVIFQWRSQRLVQLIPGFSDTVSQANNLYARAKLLLFSTRARTPYSGWYSGVCAQITLGTISVITLLVCVASVIYQIAKNPDGS